MLGKAVVLRNSLSRRLAGLGSSFFFSSEIVRKIVQCYHRRSALTGFGPPPRLIESKILKTTPPLPLHSAILANPSTEEGNHRTWKTSYCKCL